MRFRLTILRGNIVLFNLKGEKRDPKFLSMDDAKKAVEVEQYLEKLTGFRFHIMMEDAE